jgi:hypothetical protein
MTRHKLNRNEFRLENGAAVNIEYWTDAHKVHVAAFDTDGRQVSTAVYEAAVGDESLRPELQEWLVDSLANTLEYDLINKPELLVKTHH